MKAIYMITNKCTGERYVGRTNNLKRRIWEHFAVSRLGKNQTMLCKALLAYSKEDFVVDVLEEVNHDYDLPDREVYWISKLSPEYNRVTGGMGCKGMKHSIDTKNLIKEAAKRQWAKMPENKKKLFLSRNLCGRRSGFVTSEITKQKLRDANLGKKQSAETIKKRSDKLKVSAIGNKNGNKEICSFKGDVFVKKYISTKEAADELKCHPSSITQVLKGRKKTCKGFSWKYGV